MTLPDDPLDRKVQYLQHQSSTILVLSAINMLMNVLTICAAVLISWS